MQKYYQIIIQEILINKKRCHFLIPEKYENNKELNDLIDLRVIHLRKKGISHKGRKGISQNVYYIDYACYTSSNIYHNRINSNLLNEIETTDDFREIRRISLEDKFLMTSIQKQEIVSNVLIVDVWLILNILLILNKKYVIIVTKKQNNIL